MTPTELRDTLERLAGPVPAPPDTVWVRQRAARLRRRRAVIRTAVALVVVASAAGGGVATIMASSRDDAAVGERLPALGASPASEVPAASDDPTVRLFDAARRDDAGSIAMLLASGVPPDSTSRDGITALMVAAFRGDVASAEILVESGATVDAANDFDATALWLAAQQGHADVAAVLLDAGADPNRTPAEPWGVTALMEAARAGRSDVVELLVERGADAEALDGLGRPTALYALDAPDPLPVLAIFRDSDVTIDHPTDPDRSIRLGDHAVEELVALLESLDARPSATPTSDDAVAVGDS